MASGPLLRVHRAGVGATRGPLRRLIHEALYYDV